MRIGNYTYTTGHELPLNKWLFSIEILARPPYMHGVFRPYVFIVAMKILEHAEYGKVDGKEMRKKGGWKRWSSPIGITFSIERYL